MARAALCSAARARPPCSPVDQREGTSPPTGLPAYAPSGSSVVAVSAFGYAQDRLARDALAGKSVDGFGEWQHRAYDGCEASIAHSVGEGSELGEIGFDNEEDSPPVAGLGLRRFGDGDERSAGAHQCGRAVQDVAADHVEHQVDFPYVFQFFGV